MKKDPLKWSWPKTIFIGIVLHWTMIGFGVEMSILPGCHYSDESLCKQVCAERFGNDFYSRNPGLHAQGGCSPSPVNDLVGHGGYCVCTVKVKMVKEPKPEKEP